MTQIEHPKIVKKKLFSPIWLLPAVALILAAWLGIQSIRGSGITVRIHFPNASGMDVGKTLVRYQGLNMGKVVDINIDKNLSGVNVDVLMDSRAEPFLRANTQFWLVKPKASIMGVQGLDAIFSGNYIGMLPGTGSLKTSFKAETNAPVMQAGSEGIILKLNTAKLGSLEVGSPIYFRQVPVGQVVAYKLNKDDNIQLTIFIRQQYAHLVKIDSQFWNVSGLNINASLSKLQINVESLAAILAGGISFNSNTNAQTAVANDSFTLYSSKHDALEGVSFILKAENTYGINEGTNIVFRGLQIGQVTHIELTSKGVSMMAKLDNDYQELLTQTAQFWVAGAKISLSGIQHPERLITGNVINFKAGTGPASSEYKLQDKAPENQKNTLHLTLNSSTNPDLSVGAEVRYKQIKIGEITSVKLNDKLTQVDYQLTIYPEFTSLITQRSYFISESAVSINATLDQVKVKTRDLNTFIKGAISLIQGDTRTQVKNNANLSLFASTAVAEDFFAQKNTLKLSLQSQDGAGLSTGSPIYYKKMQIGRVNQVIWSEQKQSFTVKLNIQRQFKSLINNRTVFWQNSAISFDASLSGLEVNIAPLKGALRGSIALGLLEQNQTSNPALLYATKKLALSQAQAITLNFPAEAKLKAKAAIRYLGYQIGEVESVSLNTDLKSLTATAYLYGEYAAPFLRTDAQYSLVNAQIDLTGIKAPETLLTGAYIKVSPGLSQVSSTQFSGTLHAQADIKPNALQFTLTRAQLDSFKVGTPLFFRGIQIGLIDRYSLSGQGTFVTLNAHVDPQYRYLVNNSSQFWDLSGIKVNVGLFSGAQVDTGSLETILAGGIGVVTKDTTIVENTLKNGDSFIIHDKKDPQWDKWSPVQIMP
ncbi:MlaD family protein [Shewanella surugensis]|uniref:MlaD family protein n=1 Tax=Shewanella surugensis TaxID=212020 RepID=A0ABT0LC56_9GAMM|nr:MlaD family protein [Shewanella surugensis]MCL1124932.1 MlaD family protein [Shewanella surugensis]